MRIIFLGNMDDIHTPKWAQYFIDHGHDCLKFHVKHFSVKRLMELRETINQWKPDILHAHYAGTWGLMGAYTGFHPFVVTIHGSEVLLTVGWKKWLVKWVLKKVDVVTTDGKHIIDRVTEEWGIDPDKVFRINFGVDVDRFRRPEGFKPFDKVVSVRVGPDKLYDIETVEKARKIVDEQMPGVKWNFLKNVSPEMMPQALYSSTVYVSAATSDAGLSSTTAEAMACEVPVIVTNVADNAEWVEETVNGFLFNTGDYQTLANRILFSLRDKVIQRCYGERARKLICDKNNYFAEMAKMEKLYRRVLTNE